MIERQNSTKGYVYILEVADIDLPVCKIGRTGRKPVERCAEINNSSTGDFIWKVTHQVAVDDSQRLESMIHAKLEPLRQKNREFFQLRPNDAYRALRSIIESQPDINEIKDEEIVVLESGPQIAHRGTSSLKTFRPIDSKYASILQSFVSLLGVKGRPFGQLNKPEFGISDGYEGVQWNIDIFPAERRIQIGVNLEGMKYTNWPIATFIRSELVNPSIDSLKTQLAHSDLIFVRFVRDAWQAQSRPDIIDKHLGAEEPSIQSIDSKMWQSMLRDALSCLDELKGYRGRNKQVVTLLYQPKKGERKREMQVSPHLTIWTPIDEDYSDTADLESGIERLKPVHSWISRIIR
jgi:hypothetical protein